MSRDGFAAIEREENQRCDVTQLEFDALLCRAARLEIALRNVGAASSIFAAREVARRALEEK